MTSPRRLARFRCLLLPGLALALAACSSSSGGDAPPVQNARLLVTADTTVIEPAAAQPSAAARDAMAAAFGPGAETARYVLTTPADTPFAFDVVSWAAGTAGTVAVRVQHLRDGGVDPAGDPASLSVAGIAPEGRQLANGNGWLSARGDGMARLSLKGRVTRDQVLAVATEDGALALVELRIGDASAINRPTGGGGGLPGDVVTEHTLYSSNSNRFGMPAVAVSGDRTSIVCYEGDRAAPFAPSRFELRLQHDAATGDVTGGGSVAVQPDAYWRDHEIAALHNVLVVARAEAANVRVRLSFDRGATFAQDVELPNAAAQARLVQVAMAADYSLAIAYWRDGSTQLASEFVLVEGRPSAADATGSPTWFTFDPPQVVRSMPTLGMPLTTGIAWSDGGDLVIGYGITTNVALPGIVGWRMRTEFRCATRRYGEPLRDRLVDEQTIFGMDPSVAVLGSGATLRVYYAYETLQGLRLAHSDDGGDTFAIGEAFGAQGDHQPAVFARDVGGAVRLDVLYLAPRAEGVELHQARWLDGPSSPREDAALTHAQLTPTALTGGGSTMRIRQVSWLGFDAVRDGEALVVVYDQHTFDAWGTCWGALVGVPTATTGSLPPTFGGFQPAEPPPLAPGLTEPVPPAVADHAHQLKLLRIE